MARSELLHLLSIEFFFSSLFFSCLANYKAETRDFKDAQTSF